MRLFAVGDIHGCATAFDTLLTAIALQPADQLVTLGDYINKGPDSRAVLDRLIQLSNADVLVPLLGNHELKLLRAYHQGQIDPTVDTGVDQHTLQSYARGWWPPSLASIPNSHWNFLQNQCLRWFTTSDHIFVHGTVTSDQPLLAQPDQALFWQKLDHPMPHCSGKIVVCGHTPQRSGQPLNLGHTLCLDTAACEGQWLTCLEVNSGQIWQANQQGHLRQSHLQDYGPMPQVFPYPAKERGAEESWLPPGPVPGWPSAAKLVEPQRR